MGDAQVAAYLPAYGRLKTRQYSTPRLTLRLRCWRKGTADGLEEREEDELDDDVGGDWPGKEGEVGHHVRFRRQAAACDRGFAPKCSTGTQEKQS